MREPFGELFGDEGPELELDQAELEAVLGPGVCRECGCTEDDPCPDGCIWATAACDLCSRCAR